MTYTATMFSLATINIAMNLDIQSISYVNNRDFPGFSDLLGSGPAGYQFFITSKAIQVVPTAILFFNFWLGDGLLVSSVPNAAINVFNVDRSSSSIVALSSMA